MFVLTLPLVHNTSISSAGVHRAYQGWATTYEQDLLNLRTTGTLFPGHHFMGAFLNFIGYISLVGELWYSYSYPTPVVLCVYQVYLVSMNTAQCHNMDPQTESTWRSLVYNVNITPCAVREFYQGWAGLYDQDQVKLRTGYTFSCSDLIRRGFKNKLRILAQP